MTGPQIALLPDGRRLHLNHGPIDLVVEAFGPPAEIEAAYRQATDRFATVLNELVSELPELRRPAGREPRGFSGPTAQRMEQAACAFAERFVTPMAAVAGSVADEMLAAMVAGRALERAYVNDGGDVAFFLGPDQSIRAAIGGTAGGMSDRVEIAATDPVRGIATSGWRGRSHSLGIADAVTVLAHDAATADIAATLIANAVDLPGHASISRLPANELAPDSDLGDRLVTVDVAPLAPEEAARALQVGLALAKTWRRSGLIHAAALFLSGEVRLCGDLASADALSFDHALPRPPARHGRASFHKAFPAGRHAAGQPR